MKIKDKILLSVKNSDIVDGHVTIPASVEYIGCFAFANCTRLRSVTLPKSVKYIGDYAFDNCTSLTSAPAAYKAFFVNDGKIFTRQNSKPYKVGHKSFARGKLKPCKNGLHYCTNIFDIFNYYSGNYSGTYGEDFVIALCDVSEENIGNEEDSKRWARWVKPIKILSREEVIKIMNGEEVK